MASESMSHPACKADSSRTTCRSFSAGDVILSSEPWIWAFQWKVYGQICAFCFTERGGLRTCSGCKLHCYCNAICQAADWKKEHKRECSHLKAIATEIAPNTVSQQASREQRDDMLAGFVSEILMTKLAWKLKLNVVEEVSGLGKKSPSEILNLFPRNTQPAPEDELHPRMPVIRSSIFAVLAAETHIPISNLEDILKVVQFNGFPILQPVHLKKWSAGTALISQARHRSMTPVCMDVTVSLGFQGREFFVHAVEHISNYTGLGDLRYNEVTAEFCMMSRNDRRYVFEDAFGHPCQCRKCTEEYDAEKNPLKCGTTGCLECIPSDNRACKPCPQCGALNDDRLKRFQCFVQQYDEQGLTEMKKADLLEKMDALGLLHGDAHIRFLCGWNMAMVLASQKRYEEGWQLFQDFVVCLRKAYPEYHIERARLLIQAAACPVVGLKAVVGHEIPHLSPSERLRLLSVFRKGCMMALSYCREARNIYVKLCGRESAVAIKATHLTADVESQLDEGRQITAANSRVGFDRNFFLFSKGTAV